MKYKLLLSIFSLIISFNAVGDWTSYSYSAAGYMKCENVNKLVEEGNTEFKNMIISWFNGYYTGRNYETSSYPAITDSELIYIETINYCNSNPLENTIDLADYLYSSLI